MKDELLKQLLPIVEKTKEGLLKGINLIVEQCPLIIQEILNWEMAISIIGIIFSILCVFIFFKLIKPTTLACESGQDEDVHKAICGVITMIVTGLFALIAMPFCVCKLTKILVAPKLYLIEYITNLIN